VVAKKWISLLIEFMLSRFLFVDVPVTGTFSESCTPNGTFWEFSHFYLYYRICFQVLLFIMTISFYLFTFVMNVHVLKKKNTTILV